MGGILIGQTYFPKISPSLSFPNPAKRGLPFKGRNGEILADPLVKRKKGRNMGASFKKVKDYVIIKIGDGRTGQEDGKVHSGRIENHPAESP